MGVILSSMERVSLLAKCLLSKSLEEVREWSMQIPKRSRGNIPSSRGNSNCKGPGAEQACNWIRTSEGGVAVVCRTVGPFRHHEVSGFSTGWTGAASTGGTPSDWHFQLLFDQHLNRPPSALKAHTPRSQVTLQLPLHRRGLDLRKIEWQMITSTDITEHVLNCS